jgi:hypothetical protein
MYQNPFYTLYTVLHIPFLVFISNHRHRVTHLAPNQKCTNQTQSLKLPTVFTALSENLHKNSKRNIIIYDFNDIMEIRKTAAPDSSPTVTNEPLI